MAATMRLAVEATGWTVLHPPRAASRRRRAARVRMLKFISVE
jgi:hypothetical protein